MKKIVISLSCFISYYSFSQIAIGSKTFDPHAQLDVTATQKGVLITRVKLKDLKSPDPFNTNIDPLPESLLVYNMGGEPAVDPGYYYWSKDQWNKLVIKDELGSVTPEGKDITSEELSITPDGKGAVLKEIALSIKDTVISADMLKDQAVIPVKIKSGIAGQILTTKKDNTVAWAAPSPSDIPGKDLSSDHLEITNDGKEAVLKDTKLTIKNDVINTAMLQDEVIIPVKIKHGTPNQILTTDAAGKAVVWTDPPIIEDKNISSNHLKITGGDGAVLKETKLSIKDSVISTAMLEDKAVTSAKIEPGVMLNQILITKEDERGNKVSSWEVPTTIIDGKNITSNHLDVLGNKGAVLQDTKLAIKNDIIESAMIKNGVIEAFKIKSGAPNTILTTNSSSQVIWADPQKVTITNELVSEGAGENTIKSTVNGMNATTDIIKEVVNTVTVNDNGEISLKTTVNNVPSNIVNIPSILPKGLISMWSGDPKNIPAGWLLCDGTNDTPDLRGRFVVGQDQKNEDYKEIGNTGGQETVTLSVEQMPKHKHEGKTSIAGKHKHSLTIPTPDGSYPGWGGGSNINYVYQNTDEQGDHQHDLLIDDTGGNKPHENRPPYYVLAYIMFNR